MRTLLLWMRSAVVARNELGDRLRQRGFGWSRCGEWPQFAQHERSSVCGARCANARRPARGYRIRRRSPARRVCGHRRCASSSSIDQARNARVQPDVVPAPERRIGIVVIAGKACPQLGRAVRDRAPLDAARSTTSSTKMCGATATTPATASGKHAAWISAIDAAVAVAEQPGPPAVGADAKPRKKRAAARRCACRCMKSTLQRSSAARGVERP